MVEVRGVPVANQALELARTAVDAAEGLAKEAKREAATAMSSASRASFAGAILVVVTLVGSAKRSRFGTEFLVFYFFHRVGRTAANSFPVDLDAIAMVHVGPSLGRNSRTDCTKPVKADNCNRSASAARLRKPAASGFLAVCRLHRLHRIRPLQFILDKHSIFEIRSSC